MLAAAAATSNNSGMDPGTHKLRLMLKKYHAKMRDTARTKVPWPKNEGQQKPQDPPGPLLGPATMPPLLPDPKPAPPLLDPKPAPPVGAMACHPSCHGHRSLQLQQLRDHHWPRATPCPAPCGAPWSLSLSLSPSPGLSPLALPGLSRLSSRSDSLRLVSGSPGLAAARASATPGLPVSTSARSDGWPLALPGGHGPASEAVAALDSLCKGTLAGLACAWTSAAPRRGPP